VVAEPQDRGVRRPPVLEVGGQLWSPNKPWQEHTLLSKTNQNAGFWQKMSGVLPGPSRLEGPSPSVPPVPAHAFWSPIFSMLRRHCRVVHFPRIDRFNRLVKSGLRLLHDQVFRIITVHGVLYNHSRKPWSVLELPKGRGGFPHCGCGPHVIRRRRSLGALGA